jgi:C4-dicarboxylate-specific signal transduction histidine kinase
MLGKSPFDFVHPDYHAVVAEHIRRMLELGEAAPLIEMRIFRLDGALRTVDAAGATIMYQGVLSVQAVLRDVTAQKEAEGRLRRREAELAHLSRLHTIGEMTAALAHELNQPLQAINNYVRGAQRRLKNPGAAADLAPIVDAMERVSREVGRAADIVTHLRDFIQGREPHRSSVDVAALLQQAVALLQAVARDKDVAVELQPVADLPAVHADAIQVEQVVVNLVTNAVDAAAGLPPPRRKVTIAARRAESAAAEGGGAEGGAVEIAVRDCGRGVPENLKDKLFEPFVTTKENGLGFGLAISRSIVESHGGKIWVVHQEPHGVAFHFTLLLAAVREEP